MLVVALKIATEVRRNLSVDMGGFGRSRAGSEVTDPEHSRLGIRGGRFRAWFCDL